MNEILITALEHLAWPVVVLVAIFSLRRQLSKLLSSLRIFKAGSIEVVFDERLKRLKLETSKLESLRDLTHEEISLFLLISYSDAPEFKYEPGLLVGSFHSQIEALESAGLISVTIPEDNPDHRCHSLTIEGKRIRSIVIESTTRLFQEHA